MSKFLGSRLKKRAIYKAKIYPKSRLSSVLWLQFLDVISEEKIEQIAYAKEANKMINIVLDEGREVEWMYEF